jgi:hypothetical protein
MKKLEQKMNAHRSILNGARKVAFAAMASFIFITCINAQDVVAPLHNKQRRAPCEQYTVPGSTIDLWDWTAEEYDLVYYPGNASLPREETVDAPFSSTSVNFAPNTAFLAFGGNSTVESSPEEGWELLFYNLGTAGDPVYEPSFGLYNRYDAKVRVFLWLTPDGESTYQSSRVALRHVTVNNSEGVLFQKVSSILEHLNMPSNALSDFSTSPKEVSQINQVIINGTWHLLEFAATYDPCVCLHSTALMVEPKLSNVSELTFELEGSGSSTAQTVSTSTAALDYVTGFPDAIVSGYKNYKELNALSNSGDLDGNLVEVFGALMPSWFPQAGFAAKVLGFFLGGGKSSTASTVGFNHDFKFTANGDIINAGFYQPYLFYTPGAYYEPLLSSANRPFYDNPLGVINLLEPPVIEETYTQEVYANQEGEYDIRFAKSYRFVGDLKYAINTKAGISGQPIRLMGSLVFPKCEENRYGSDAELNQRFEATPAINVTCLEDYVYKGENYISVYYDQHKGWVSESIADGCTERPEFQLIAVLENALNPDADEILFSARYRPKFITASYEFAEAPTNPFEGLTEQELALLCDEQPIPASVTEAQLKEFCKNNYNPDINLDSPDPDLLNLASNINTEMIELDKVFRAAPNPFRNHLSITLDLHWEPQDVNLRITDALGRVVWEDSFFYSGGPLHYQIDQNLEALANGVYQAQVQSGQEIESITILKQ